MKHRIKFGICLDNFSDDFVRKKATPEDLIKRMAKLGYQGIELVMKNQEFMTSVVQTGFSG